MSGASDEGTFRCWIVIGLLASIILFVITQTVDSPYFQPWREALEKVSEALFIAMVLALTVDSYLKKALAKDAVQAAIGYILPPYLQQEMAAIYSNELVCIDHNQIVVLTELPNDLVQVSVRVERTLENISTAIHTFSPHIAVDEWLSSGGKSAIQEFGYQRNDERVEIAELRHATPADGNLPRLSLKIPDAKIGPKDKVRLWYDLHEIKRRGDMHVLKFRYSTNNPRVRVDAPAAFGWKVEFAHRQDAKIERYSNVTVLPGLLLPHQCIFVWWWDKAKEKTWREAYTTA